MDYVSYDATPCSKFNLPFIVMIIIVLSYVYENASESLNEILL